MTIILLIAVGLFFSVLYYKIKSKKDSHGMIVDQQESLLLKKNTGELSKSVAGFLDGCENWSHEEIKEKHRQLNMIFGHETTK